MSCEHPKTCGECHTVSKTAQSLITDLALATEWNLATLEELYEIKGTSKSRRERQFSIALKMVFMCVPYFDQIKCGTRLRAIYEARQKGTLNGGSDSYEAALRKWMEKL